MGKAQKVGPLVKKGLPKETARKIAGQTKKK